MKYLMSLGVQALNSSASCLETAGAKIPKRANKKTLITPINSTRPSPRRASSHGRPLERFSLLFGLFGKSVCAASLERWGLGLPIDLSATPLLEAERGLGRACRKPVSCACRVLPPTVRPMGRKSTHREPLGSATTVLVAYP